MSLIWILLTLLLDPPVTPAGILDGPGSGAPSFQVQENPAGKEKPKIPQEQPTALPATTNKDQEGVAEAGELPPEGDPADVDAETLPETREPGFLERWRIEGKIKARARLAWETRRFSGKTFGNIRGRTERDQEFRSYLEVETRGLGHEKLNSYVHLDHAEDLDGTSDPSFHKSSLTSFSDRDHFRLHGLYVEAEDVWGPIQVRIGRQNVMEVHPVHFDGGMVQVDDFLLLGMPAKCRVFGGVLVSHFSNLRKDGVMGGSLRVEPAENLDIEFRDTNYDRNRFEVEGRWQPIPPISMLGLYGMRGPRSRDARLETAINVDSLGLTVTGGWYRRFSHDFRLDFLTGQSSRKLDERYLFLPELAPYQELYLRVSKDVFDWMAVGGEVIDHTLRDRHDASPYDTDFREFAGHVDLRLGPGSLHGEVRYYHADRRATPIWTPRFPQAAVVTLAKVGEKDHIEYHLGGSCDIFESGWKLDAGIVWNRINYSDVYVSEDHEKMVDYLVQLRGKICDRASLTVRYEHTRDMGFFSPYFDRFHAFSWILDISL